MTSKVIKNGLWRAEILIEDIAVPFHFELVNDEGRLRAFYINEPERMEVEEVICNDNSTIEFNFPSYSSRLVAHIDGEKMSGGITFSRPDMISRRCPFYAEYGKGYRFMPDDRLDHKSAVDISGTWKAEVQYSDTEAVPYIANLSQQGSKVSGCFAGPYGDSRYLSGEVRGNEFFMSIHDGGLLQHWYGTFNKDGSLSGETTNPGFYRAPWSAKRYKEPKDGGLFVEHQHTIESEQDFNFSFPDHDGKFVSLSDEKFKGKVVVVILAASWCPTCHDQAAFFVPFYKRYQRQGLEAVQVMFEFSDDWEKVKDQVMAFRKRYGITYDLLFAGNQASRDKNMPEKHIASFPTLVIKDRFGNLRKSPLSFGGPATGAKYQAYIKNFKQQIEQWLSESSA